jgi:integrase
VSSQAIPARTPGQQTPSLTHLIPVTVNEDFTYEKLKVFHLERKKLNKEGLPRSEQVTSNDLTAISQWCKQIGLDASCSVGSEFGADFEKRLDEHLAWLRTEGKSEKTIADRKSKLNGWRSSWLILVERKGFPNKYNDGLPDEFHAAIKFLLKRAGLGVHRAAVRIGLTNNRFASWASRGYYPRVEHLDDVYKVEAYFSLPKNTLVKRLPKRLFGAGGANGIKRGTTKHRRQHIINQKDVYRVNKFHPKLQGDWDRLISFFREDSSFCTREGLKRNSTWRVNDEGECPTAGAKDALVKSFFGYLCLPKRSRNKLLRGKGFSRDQLTLAQLSDYDLIDDYVRFRKLRSGCNTSEIKVFLIFCRTLLRAETGFLRQQPKFGRQLAPKLSAREWDEWCESNREKMKELMKSTKFIPSRDSFEPIEDLIELQHPVLALRELAEKIMEDKPAPSCSDDTKAAHKRNHLLVRFLTANPLRVRQISRMTYTPDNKGNLYQRRDGAWYVRYSPSDFKNERGAGKEPYDHPVPPSLWPDLEDYLFNHRKHLVGAPGCRHCKKFDVCGKCRKPRKCVDCERCHECEVCHYVFRPSHKGHKPKDKTNKPMSKGSIYEIIRYLSEHYIPNSPGFGPHAFRHLVATEYIKNNPEGYNIAASILHDRVETVRETYARIKAADKFTHWVNYHEELMRAPISTPDGVQAQRGALVGQLQSVLKQLSSLFSTADLRSLLKEAQAVAC